MKSAYLRGAVLTYAILLAIAAQAEPVQNYLPDNTLGFVLVRNLADANAKIESVTKIFSEVAPMPIPAPLPVLKAATGLGEGIDEQGDAVLALLPGTRDAPSQRPLMLAPVKDYAAFAKSINGDASGEICRVSIAGEEVLVARLDGYAILMNVEHRELLESIIGAKPREFESIKPLAEWLTQVDVAVVLTPSGVDMLTSLGRAGLASQRAAMEEQLSEPQFADSLGQLRSSLAMYEEILGFLGGELEAMALGVAIDGDANLEVHTQAVLAEGGAISKLTSVKGPQTNPLEGYRDEPYVFAFGGPIPPEYAKLGSSFAKKFLRAHPESYGFEELTEEEWTEVEATWQSAMQGMRSLSMAMLPGSDDDALYSNIYGVLKVDDAAAYLKSYAESIRIWNKLLSRNTTGIKLNYETSETELEGKKGLLLTADMSEVANDQNVPMMKPLIEAMLGKGGKMVIYLLAADDTTVFMGIAEKDEVASRIKNVLKHDQGLAESSTTGTTLALLNSKAAWVGVASPRGTVAWVTRMFALFVAQFGQGAPAIPEFPESPPVGFALSVDGKRISTEMVLPVDMLKAVAAYVKKIQDAS